MSCPSMHGIKSNTLLLSYHFPCLSISSSTCNLFPLLIKWLNNNVMSQKDTRNWYMNLTSQTFWGQTCFYPSVLNLQTHLFLFNSILKPLSALASTLQHKCLMTTCAFKFKKQNTKRESFIILLLLFCY